MTATSTRRTSRLTDVSGALELARVALDRAHDAAALWSDTVRQDAERRLGVGGDDTAAVLTDAEYGRALDVLDAVEATVAANAAAVCHLEETRRAPVPGVSKAAPAGGHITGRGLDPHPTQ